MLQKYYIKRNRTFDVFFSSNSVDGGRFYHIEFGLTEQRYLVTTSTAGDLALLYWQSGLLAPVYKQLSLVPALIPAQDLLFLGGDSMTVEWSALSRLATSSRLCQ